MSETTQIAMTPRRFSLSDDPKQTLEQDVEEIATALVKITGLARHPGEVLNEDTLPRIAAFLHGEIDNHIASVRLALMQRGLGRSRFSLDAPPPVRPEVPIQRQVLPPASMLNSQTLHTIPIAQAEKEEAAAPGRRRRQKKAAVAEPKVLGKLVGSKQTGEVIVVEGLDPVRPPPPEPGEVNDEVDGITDAGFIDG